MDGARHNSMFDQTGEGILGELASLRRRGRLIALASGLCWVAMAGTLLLASLVTALGWWGGEPLRIAGWTAVVALVGAVLVFAVVLPLRRIGDLESVARRIGRVYPELASDALSGCQLAASPQAAREFSPRLLGRHLLDVGERLRRVARRRIFPARFAAIPILALAASIAGAAAARTALPGITETGLHTLWSEPRVPEKSVEVLGVRQPVVGDLSVTLRYPGYLRRSPRQLETISGGLVAPAGTTVVLEGRSLLPGADRGSIVLPGGAESDLSVHSDGRVAGRFVVLEPGTFSLRLGDESRLLSGLRRRLDVEPDSPPEIRLLRPAGEVEVDRAGELVLEFEAEDDHGLSRIDLVVRAGDHDAVRKTVIRAGDRVSRLRHRYRWSPQSMRLEETKLELELEAYDDDMIGGPKPGRTRPIPVEVMTRRNRHLAAVEEQRNALDALIDLLAARLENRLPPDRKPREARERFTAMRLRTEDVLGRTARLIHQLDMDSLTPQRTVESFVQVREDLSNQLLHEARLYRDPIAGFPKRQSVDRVTIRLLEAAVIRVDDVLLDQQLGRVIADGDRLDKYRLELGDLLDDFARTRTEAARRALIEAIENFERAVDRLHDELEKVRGKVADAYLNPEAVEAIDLGRALTRIRELVAAGDIEAAMRIASRMEQDLARLMAGLESGLLSFRTDRFGEAEKFIGELLDRVMEIESDQLQVRRQTTALQRRYQERLVEVMRSKIDPLVRRQLKRAEEIRTALDQLDRPEPAERRERLVALSSLVREIELALEHGDLNEARRAAEGIGSLAGDWHSELARDEGGAASSLQRVKKTALRIAAEVTDAYPGPTQLLGERDRLRVRAQANRQRHVTFRTRRMRAWIGNREQETRFLGHRARASLRTAEDHMEQAVTRLENKAVREALVEQSEALDELTRLRDDLRRGDQAAPLESRPVVLGADVEIPDPGEYEVPVEHREDILEAMRKDVPNSYREAIERYYETLVR